MIAGSVVLWFIVLVLTVAAVSYSALYFAVSVQRTSNGVAVHESMFAANLLALLSVFGVLLLTGVIGS